MAALQSGELSVWSLFEDYVFLGDSRIATMTYLTPLDDSRLLGAYGDTIKKIDGHLEALDALSPSYIIMCYGLDDLLQTGWDTPEKYRPALEEKIRELQERYPDAKIFLNSIFPCIYPAFDSTPFRSKWREAPEYSEAVRQAAENTGVYFIANEDLMENLTTTYMSYYHKDGIHFTAEFYEVWCTNVIMAIYDSELGLDTEEEV